MSPGELLKNFILSHISRNNPNEILESEIPRKWEKYGDFVLFDERTFCSEMWKKQDIKFWVQISEILKCKRIGVKNKIQNDSYRTPNVTILLGDDPWIIHKDNYILYSWNVEKNMFSAGNAFERHRIGKINCENQVVVDLFAGIGYFTLPFLIHSKADFVHSCEWNPVAVEALKRNLKLNKVENKCKIHEGDNLIVCPKKVGNRVNLGLIPSSEKHWRVACEALVDNGGILHIHENVETKKTEVFCECCSSHLCNVNLLTAKNILMDSTNKHVKEGLVDTIWRHKQWLIKGIHVLHSLISILQDQDDSKVWSCSIEKVNFVKSYAPHIHHLVFDVKIENEIL